MYGEVGGGMVVVLGAAVVTEAVVMVVVVVKKGTEERPVSREQWKLAKEKMHVENSLFKTRKKALINHLMNNLKPLFILLIPTHCIGYYHNW